MPTPQVASVPWNPGEVRSLIPKSKFSWRQRCVLAALLELARVDGRVFEGNARLIDTASRLGPAVAAEMGIRRKRFPRVERAYFIRLLAGLRRRGIVDHFWPRLGPTRRWFRVLRIRIEGLRACAEWGAACGRPWRSSCDPTPAAAPLPRVYSWQARQKFNRRKTYAVVPIVRRNEWGPEWELPEENASQGTG